MIVDKPFQQVDILFVQGRNLYPAGLQLLYRVYLLSANLSQACYKAL